MENIYVVTSGNNLDSDYSINAVFSTIELAQVYVDNYGLYREFNIEVYKLNSAELGEEATLFVWRCHISEDGNIYCWAGECYEQKVKKTEMYYRRHSENDNQILVLHFMASDEEHARKIAKDKAMHIKATVGWGNLIE